MNETQESELPAYMRDPRYGPRGEKLLKACQELAKQSAPEPFFLSVRKAGEIISLDYQDAAKFLKCFCLQGYLICAERGRGTRASTYFFCDSGPGKK